MGWRVVPLMGLVIALGLGAVGVYADRKEPTGTRLVTMCPRGYELSSTTDEGVSTFEACRPSPQAPSDGPFAVTPDSRLLPTYGGLPALRPRAAPFWWYAAGAVFLVGLALPLTVGRRPRATP